MKKAREVIAHELRQWAAAIRGGWGGLLLFVAVAIVAYCLESNL